MSQSQLLDETKHWSAIVNRDAALDGTFVYAVKTTGVYCRPSCSSRRPNRSNVEFFEDGAHAEASGYRACKKCRPDEIRTPGQETVLKACRFIDTAATIPSLNDIAEHVQLSPSHFHRLFSRVMGITPKQYASSRRTTRFRQNLHKETTISQAVYAAGYESASRCYESVKDTLGMTPTSFQNKGRGQTIQYACARCHLGWLVVAATDVGICLIEFGDSRQHIQELLQNRFSSAELIAGDEQFQQWVTYVVEFVKSPAASWNLPLDLQGTAFQRQVWQALQAIPPGETRTYTELAELIGRPRAVRAVASACAANKLAVVIPCHRVLRSDGSISGYRWGVERKRELLSLEESGDRARFPEIS